MSLLISVPISVPISCTVVHGSIFADIAKDAETIKNQAEKIATLKTESVEDNMTIEVLRDLVKDRDAEVLLLKNALALALADIESYSRVEITLNGNIDELRARLAKENKKLLNAHGSLDLQSREVERYRMEADAANARAAAANARAADAEALLHDVLAESL